MQLSDVPSQSYVAILRRTQTCILLPSEPDGAHVGMMPIAHKCIVGLVKLPQQYILLTILSLPCIIMIAASVNVDVSNKISCSLISICISFVNGIVPAGCIVWMGSCIYLVCTQTLCI